MRARLVIWAGYVLTWSGVVLLIGRIPIPGFCCIIVGLGVVAEVKSWNTVKVKRSLAIHAEPDRAWSLLASPAVWSLRAGCWAFDVTGPAGTGPVRISLRRTPSGGVACYALEVTGGQPGRPVRLGSASQKTAALAYTVSVVPAGQRARAVIGVKARVRRGTVLDARPAWRKDLTAWLRECAAVLEGRSPWPGDDMPVGVRTACTARMTAQATVNVPAATLISAPADRVWQVLWDPATSLLLSPGAVAAGQVPGTPAGQAGEMQYTVTRTPDGELRAAIVVVLEVATGHSAVTRCIDRVETEMHYLLQPEASGTRLTLACRYYPPVTKDHTDLLQDGITEFAARYKTLLEEPGVEKAAPSEPR
jgi:uncharacterized protein YndB with AHSA1/START domain